MARIVRHSRNFVSALTPVLFLAASMATIGCNPNPPRQPAIKQTEGDKGSPVGDGSQQNPEELTGNRGTGEIGTGGTPSQGDGSRGSNREPVPEGNPPSDESIEPPADKPVVDEKPGTGEDPGKPNDPSTPVDPEENPQNGEPKTHSIVYKTYFKAAEPNVPDKRHGSWNLNCLSLKNGAGAQIASSVCNKKPADGCNVFHAENQGVSKSIGSEVIDGTVEILLDITRGGERCKNGELAADDTFGFRYLEADLSSTKPTSYTSGTNDTDNRFKCAKKMDGGKSIYKICMEDNLSLYESDPAIWDFNDYVLILESSRDIILSGLTCSAEPALFELPEGRCK